MKGFNECPNGHYYQTHLNKCPYCPSGETQYAGNMDKTVIDSGSDSDRTVVDNGLDKTVFDAPEQMQPDATPKKDLSKTFIKTDDMEEDERGVEKNILRERRKLVGWLVSYTVDSLGRDFRVYEGRNTLGNAVDNDMVLSTDPSISSHHAVILFRNNTFYIQDKLSTNGTKLNGTELEPDVSVVFQDKAEIHLGDTVLYFRTAQ
jgi:hypothetical protein